jgi:hypothetical protein
MKKSIKVDQKKKRGRPATGRGLLVSSRIPEPIVGTVDAWALQNETTRSDAIRRLVEIGLKAAPTSKPARSTSNNLRAQELAARAIEKLTNPATSPDERAQRRRRLTKGPPEFRDDRVDLPKVNK